MHEVFQIDHSNNFNLRKSRGFKPGNPKTVYYGTETISVLGPILWVILSDEYKNSTSNNSTRNLKLRLRSGCLQTVHVVYARHTFQMLALFNFN